MMDNQNSLQNTAQNPSTPQAPLVQQTAPIQNQPVVQVPPPVSKSFLSSKIILLIAIVLIIIIIGAGGAYLSLNSKSKSQPIVQNPTPILTATPTLDPTANWKTYTDKIGYSIKVPTSWTIEEVVRENFSCTFLTEEIAKAMTICFSTEKFLNVWPEYASESGKMKITINGYDAYENTINPGAFFLLNSKGEFASIQGSLLDKKVFGQILSTFKFTNSENS